MQQELTKSAAKLWATFVAADDKTLKIDALTYMSGLCDKTVFKCLSELKSKGYLHYEKGKGKVKTYQLLH